MRVISLVDVIDYHGRIEPEKPAVIAGTSIVTFGMLRDVVNEASRRIGALGLEPGAVVAVWVTAPARHLALSLALARVGLVSAPIANQAGLALLGHVAVVLCDPGANAGARGVEVGDDWFTVAPADGAQHPTRVWDDDAPMRIVASSGTTGTPKAIVNTVLSVETHADAISIGLDMAAAYERLLSMMDLPSAWGYFTAIAVLSRGKTVCFAASAEDALRLISVYRCDYLIGSVFQLRAVVASQRRKYVPVPSLRAVTVGGSLVPAELISGIQATLAQRILLQYGSTEAGVGALEIVGVFPWQEGATGLVTPWTEMDILGDDGSLLPPGAEGELRQRSTGQAQIDAESVEGELPWFRPGDRATVSAQGRLRISGRASDVINLAGIKVAPEYIEELLMAFPGVTDAGVAAVPGADGLDTIAAAVACDGSIDLEALAVFCRSANEILAPTSYRQVTAIPRGETRKILRRDLRELLLSP